MDEHSSVAENGQADGIGWMNGFLKSMAKYMKFYNIYFVEYLNTRFKDTSPASNGQGFI